MFWCASWAVYGASGRFPGLWGCSSVVHLSSWVALSTQPHLCVFPSRLSQLWWMRDKLSVKCSTLSPDVTQISIVIKFAFYHCAHTNTRCVQEYWELTEISETSSFFSKAETIRITKPALTNFRSNNNVPVLHFDVVNKDVCVDLIMTSIYAGDYMCMYMSTYLHVYRLKIRGYVDQSREILVHVDTFEGCESYTYIWYSFYSTINRWFGFTKNVVVTS